MKMILIQLLLLSSDFKLDIVNLKNAKHLKMISEELIPIVWHRRRWWNDGRFPYLHCQAKYHFDKDVKMMFCVAV